MTDPGAVDGHHSPCTNKWLWLAVIAAAPILVLFGPWALLSAVSTDQRYPVERVPARPVAIVFGAGLEPDGRPSAFLAQRLDATVRLWQLHKVQHILVSGDNSTIYHDEVTAMRAYLVERGVPESVITRDYAGFNSYDTCYRAHADFGVDAAILVTQDYHLARVLWTCRHLGIDAVGVGPSRWRQDPGLMARFQLRELLSDGKALWQTEVHAPAPTFPDKPEVLH